MPITVEMEHEFKQRHGNETVPINNGRSLLFADGAQCDIHCQREFWQEPPTGRALLDLKRLFHSTKLATAEEAFHALKSAMSAERFYTWPEATLGPAPSPDDGKVALKHLVGVVKKHRAAVAKIDALIEDLPETKRRREKEKETQRIDEQMRQRWDEEKAEIEAITLD